MEYEYATITQYGDTAEVKRFERRPLGGRRGKLHDADQVPRLSDGGENLRRQKQRQKARTEANARSAARTFRRLVAANLSGRSKPLLVSLTYRENQTDLDRARSDFNAFARNASNTFGAGFKYISVVEFQERGAIHFHVLVWGVVQKAAKRERRTRIFASLWNQGFTDVKLTDGSPKLSTYLAKYFKDTFQDERLSGRRAYTASRNIDRPLYIRDAIVAPYFSGLVEPDLSTYHLAQDEEYDTTWLGRCNYKRYLTLQ